MANILTPAVEKYLAEVVPPRDAVVADMERYAREHNVPIIGPECGRLLYLLTQISGPQTDVYFTDSDPKNVDLAKENFRKAGLTDRVHILLGDAVELIDTVSGEFDIILIDVFKRQYPAALKKSLPRLKHGGLVIADNVLWSGKVTEPAKDDDTRGVVEFNKMVYSSSELFPVIVPLRDGVAVCCKA